MTSPGLWEAVGQICELAYTDDLDLMQWAYYNDQYYYCGSKGKYVLWIDVKSVQDTVEQNEAKVDPASHQQ